MKSLRESVHQQAADAVNEAVRQFAAFVRDEWTMPENKAEWRQKLGTSDDYPGDDYMRGYNAGVESVVAAAELFLDEVIA